MKVLVTGANGHIGRKLIGVLKKQDDVELIAMVRSKTAADTVRRDHPDIDVRIVDYRDAAGIKEAGAGCDRVVHLVGIIKETAANSFSMAHEEACEALLDADLAVESIVCLGIVGTDSRSDNACFRSRAAAERILLSGATPATIIRVPMVLGEEDYASISLAKKARSKVVFTFRGKSLEQPIDSDDVISAIVAALNSAPVPQILELAGPESLTRAELIRKAGQRFNNSPLVISIPMVLGYVFAGILEAISSNPPVTASMLGVLDHDDQVDVAKCCDVLQLSLTPLDATLAKVLH